MPRSNWITPANVDRKRYDLCLVYKHSGTGKYIGTIERFANAPELTYCVAVDPNGKRHRSGALQDASLETCQKWCEGVISGFPKPL